MSILLSVLASLALIIRYLPQSVRGQINGFLAHPALFWVLFLATGIAAYFSSAQSRAQNVVAGLFLAVFVISVLAIGIGLIIALFSGRWHSWLNRVRLAVSSIGATFVLMFIIIGTLSNSPEVTTQMPSGNPGVLATTPANIEGATLSELPLNGSENSSALTHAPTTALGENSAINDSVEAPANIDERAQVDGSDAVEVERAVNHADATAVQTLTTAVFEVDETDRGPVQEERPTVAVAGEHLESVRVEAENRTFGTPVPEGRPFPTELDPSLQALVEAMRPRDAALDENASDPIHVSFVIESHPVSADIYTRTRMGESLELVGRGSAELTVPAGTRITYAIRPLENTGYLDFEGSVIANSDATHPVWLEPAPVRSLPNPNNYPHDTPERVVAQWMLAYAQEDWWGMVDVTSPGQDREMAYSWLEGTYFFRPYQRLISIQTISNNGVAARVTVTWEHGLGWENSSGRSEVTLVVIRDNPMGQPAASAPWAVSYTSALNLRTVD